MAHGINAKVCIVGGTWTSPAKRLPSRSSVRRYRTRNSEGRCCTSEPVQRQEHFGSSARCTVGLALQIQHDRAWIGCSNRLRQRGIAVDTARRSQAILRAI
jgi:hypothetical protein